MNDLALKTEEANLQIDTVLYLGPLVWSINMPTAEQWVDIMPLHRVVLNPSIKKEIFYKECLNRVNAYNKKYIAVDSVFFYNTLLKNNDLSKLEQNIRINYRTEFKYKSIHFLVHK